MENIIALIFSKFGEYGAIGLVCILTIADIWIMQNRIFKITDKSIKVMEGNTKAIAEFTEAVRTCPRKENRGFNIPRLQVREFTNHE